MNGLRSLICALVLIFEEFECNIYLHYIHKRSVNCGDSPCRAPEIKSSPQNYTVALGETKTLKCRAIGNPLPRIKWKKNGEYIGKLNRPLQVTTTDNLDKNGRIKKGTRKVARSQLKINSLFNKDLAYYTCIATNNIAKVESAEAYITLNHEKTSLNSANVPGSSLFNVEREGQCVPYTNNTTCQQYLDPNRSIYADHNHAINITENVLKLLQESFDKSAVILSSRCRPFAMPFLCYYNFPYCGITQTGKPVKISICYSACMKLSNYHCQLDFQKAKDDKALKVLIPSDCDSLPKTNCTDMNVEMSRVQAMLNDNGEGARETGYRKPMSRESFVDVSDNCFFEKGHQYRGIVNITESNTKCVTWPLSSVKKDVLLTGHNYCRNPGSLHDRPWCYVKRSNSKELDFEYCDLPRCATPIRPQISSILYTIIPCLLVALALALVIITLAWRRHKQHYYQSPPSSPKQVVPRVNPKIQELNREDLCDFRLLGDGSIGRVYTADYTGSKDGRTFTACVAVKAIIEKAYPKQIEDFVREAETRANFKHENVVSLIGVISKEEPLSLIYEYTEYGDLHEYLLQHSPNFSDAHANDDCEPLEYADLLVIATQIASGMSYLSTHAFVHKDLAARNCLVADNGIIKISDVSGLCDLYASDYYRVPGHQPLPVRWMSPESISDMNFSTASDIWSYGVVLWEVFSYGSRPYFGLSNYQGMQQIVNYGLLSCPEGCPVAIYNIMLQCWIREPNARKAFVESYNQLKALNSMTSASMQMHPQLSVHSLQSTMASSNGPSGVALSNGYAPSLPSRHSSIHSINSSHQPASFQSTQHSMPPSLSSIPHSNHSINGHNHSINSHHHSLSSDGHHSLPRDHSYPIRDEHHSISRGGHHSLSHDGHHSLSRDGHYPPQHGDTPASINSSHQPTSMHSNGYISTPSYVSTLPSYPPSLVCPSAFMFSRQSSSRASSHAPSVRSYDSGRNGSYVPGSHIYL